MENVGRRLGKLPKGHREHDPKELPKDEHRQTRKETEEEYSKVGKQKHWQEESFISVKTMDDFVKLRKLSEKGTS